MQKAIENYIESESKKNVSLEEIEKDINKVTQYEVRKARQDQYRNWRIQDKRR